MQHRKEDGHETDEDHADGRPAGADANWQEFCRRYAGELKANPAFASFTATVMSHPVVTLLYSSHDSEHNNAVVLRDILVEKE